MMSLQLASSIVRKLGLRGDISAKIPKLQVDERSDYGSRTIWFICPDYQRPSGGIRKLYGCVDTLNSAGLHAAIVHSRPGFRCDWFNNSTRVVNARDAWVRARDILVVPEIYGSSICRLPHGIRQVIFNQNVYKTVDQLADAQEHASPYRSNPNLVLVLVVSQDNAAILNKLFPGIPVRRLQLGIDPTLYYVPSDMKRRRIAYMPRKRRADASEVIRRLEKKGALEGWEVVAIDGNSEDETARILRSSRLFLSFSKKEGFGLPPLEALACGCAVVGYHGSGGREYFHPPFATVVEEGDNTMFVDAVERILNSIDRDPASFDALASKANRFVTECYTVENERQTLIDIFAPLVQ